MPPPPAAEPPIHPARLRRARDCLRRGGLLAYPTEAVFGLGCDPLRPDAVLRLLRLKRRPLRAGLILIAADPDQLAPYLAPLPAARRRVVNATWPGPVTWIWPARPGTPDWLTGGRDSIAVRLTAHPLARALCRAWGGALVSTSANPHRRPPARTALQVRRYFGDHLDLILHGATGPARRPTEIRDARTGARLRAGDGPGSAAG